MILRGTEASRYCTKPDAARPGLLIYGGDVMHVALKRAEAIAALIGPQGEADMRLTRLSGGDLRRDGSLLTDALTSPVFFPGPRAVWLEEATDGLTDTVAASLKNWRAGDGTLVVTAANLTGKSTLKTLFDKHPTAICIGLFDDPPSREEIERELNRAGLLRIDPAAMADLTTLAHVLDPGDFRQTLTRVALYKHNDPSPLTSAEVASLAPATVEADVDDLIHAAADGRVAEVGPLMRRLEGQGTSAVTICIAALRHFRNLHAATCDPGKPRLFGPRRDAAQRQASAWGMRLLEQATSLLVETDLTLRSASRAPTHAVMERALIRLAMMKR
jgi:DNA polymerase-3 subunit delta